MFAEEDVGFRMFGMWKRIALSGDIALKFIMRIAVYATGEMFVLGSAYNTLSSVQEIVSPETSKSPSIALHSKASPYDNVVCPRYGS